MSLGLNNRSIVRLLIRTGNCALVELGTLIRLILLSASNLVQDIIVYMRCTAQSASDLFCAEVRYLPMDNKKDCYPPHKKIPSLAFTYAVHASPLYKIRKQKVIALSGISHFM